MLSQYIDEKLHRAAYKMLEDGTYFGEVPGMKGVWADGKTLEECRNELRDALESWLVVSLRHGDAIPELDATDDKEYA